MSTLSVSIPRLELMAALLGLQLALKVSKAMELDMATGTFWSDSAKVLHWVRSYSHRFKPFATNRISGEQQATTPSQWRYVPTDDNPAGLVSWGYSVTELVGDSIWWQGPPLLKELEAKWPPMPSAALVPDAEERKAAKASAATLVSEELPVLCPRRFSEWTEHEHGCTDSSAIPASEKKT